MVGQYTRNESASEALRYLENGSRDPLAAARGAGYLLYVTFGAVQRKHIR